jgi:hypothetical protein
MTWIKQDTEGSGRGLFQSTLTVFASRNWGKLRQISVKISFLQVEVWTKSFRKMNNGNHPVAMFGQPLG